MAAAVAAVVVAVVRVEVEGVAAAWTWPDKVTTPLAASQQLVSESPSDIQYTCAPTHAHSAMAKCIVILLPCRLVVWLFGAASALHSDEREWTHALEEPRRGATWNLDWQHETRTFSEYH